jgi:hypothetical protein
MAPLIQFTTPPDGLIVTCECGSDTFRLAVHAKRGGALIKRTATCTECERSEEI